MSYGDLQSQERNSRRLVTSIGAPEGRFGLEPEALTDLMPSVYEELRRLAADYLKGERPGHTLQPTALVHEAYLWLLRQGQTTWQNDWTFAKVWLRRELSR